MADIELVIKIPENYYLSNIQNGSIASKIILNAVSNGTPLPKGNGNKYEAKAITRGNCMMCGKELTEGLFFCKECEDKGK